MVNMKEKNIFSPYQNEIYYFILKKVKDDHIGKDIFQNVFLKALENQHQLKDEQKTRAWLFQITRNEIADYFNQESVYVPKFEGDKNPSLAKESNVFNSIDFCCYETFVNDLPKIYKDVVDLIYNKGIKQQETAEILDISLPNVKARVKRAKDILKNNFEECCQYQLDKDGFLTGEPDCVKCDSILNENF